MSKRQRRITAKHMKRHYDWLARIYDLQEQLFLERLCYAGARSRAVERLRLTPGATVLDVACGTGVNLPLLQHYLQDAGRIVAIDLSDAMLRRAKARALKRGWQNVRFVQADAALLDREKLGGAGAIEPGQQIDAAVCTFGLSVIPEWEMVYCAMRRLVCPGGRLVIMDGGSPERGTYSKQVLLRPLWRLLCWLGRSSADRRPWLKLADDLPDAAVETFSRGYIRVAWGTVPTAD